MEDALIEARGGGRTAYSEWRRNNKRALFDCVREHCHLSVGGTKQRTGLTFFKGKRGAKMQLAQGSRGRRRWMLTFDSQQLFTLGKPGIAVSGG